MKNPFYVSLLLLLTILLVSCSSSPEKTVSPEYPAAAENQQAQAPTVIPADSTQGSAAEVSPTERPMFPYEGPYPYPGGLPLRITAVQPTIEYDTSAYIPPLVDPPATATPVIPVVVPTPKTDLGIVTGKLLSSDPDNPPYIATLYLGSTIKADKEGFPPMVSLSADTDPKALQDDTGAFLFTDVKPGIYALVVWDPYNSVVVQDEKKENYLTFEVKAGEVTDLGTILYP